MRRLKIIFKNLTPPILLNSYRTFKFKLIYWKYKKFFIQNTILKDSMVGERCFIFGSGHSINSADITRFKNENIIGLNSFMFHQDYQELMNSVKGFKAHVFTPLHEMKTLDLQNSYLEELEENILENVKNFFGIDDFKYNYIDEFTKKNNADNFNKYYIHANTAYEVTEDFNESSYDCAKTTWSHKTSSNMALFLALYLGFKDIYLLGVDHDHMNADPSNVKGIKKGILAQAETELLETLHQKYEKGGSQVNHLKDLIAVIRPMEIIEENFPLRVKNLSKQSIFYCHEVVEIDSLDL